MYIKGYYQFLKDNLGYFCIFKEWGHSSKTINV